MVVWDDECDTVRLNIVSPSVKYDPVVKLITDI